jgi:cytochrome P450/NADPH-cytochrome P450 reductase
LFFGCNHAEVDFLYREELARWQADGLVTVLPAFFHQPDGEIYFVQHRLARERTRVRELMDRGATVFVCGDGRHMAPAVRATFARLHRDQTGCSEQDAQAWIAGLEQNGRYVADVFA